MVHPRFFTQARFRFLLHWGWRQAWRYSRDWLIRVARSVDDDIAFGGGWKVGLMPRAEPKRDDSRTRSGAAPPDRP